MVGDSYPKISACAMGKPLRVTVRHSDRAPALERRSAASDVAARAGGSGREAYRFVDWLAAAGQTWWQVLPLGPPDRYRSPYKARSAFAAWPGLLADPRAPVSRCRGGRRFGSGRRSGPWTGSDSPGAGRWPIRCASNASGPRCGRTRAERGVRLFGDVAIYVAPGERGPARSPGAVPRRLRRRRPAGRVLGDRAAVGQPAVRLAGAAPAAVPLVGRADAADAVAVRPRADRPLPRASSPTGRCRRGRGRAAGGRWRRGPGSARCSTPRRASRRVELPLVAEDLGVITPPVERAAATSLGFPGMLVLQFGFDPDDPRSPHRLENHAAIAWSTRGRTTTTPRAGGTRRWIRRRGRWSMRRCDAVGVRERREPWWGLIRLALRLARAGGDDAGAGRARAGAARRG